MEKRNIRVKLDSGLKARHIALLVQEASKYDSTIYLQSGEKRVNAKSIMGMMTLWIDISEELEVTADGTDEQEALDGIERFLGGKEVKS